jgi:hypothetical protein
MFGNILKFSFAARKRPDEMSVNVYLEYRNRPSDVARSFKMSFVHAPVPAPISRTCKFGLLCAKC